MSSNPLSEAIAVHKPLERDIRVLVVDDADELRKAYIQGLELMGYTTGQARNGAEAIDRIRNDSYDAVLLDLNMPGMDGFAACAKIRGTPLNARTPVVFVTTLSDYQSRERATEAGSCGFIPKPAMRMEVTLAALTFAFRGRLEKRRAKVDGTPKEELSLA